MDLIRSSLQPLVRQLPVPVHDLAISILGPECHQTLLVEVNLESATCVKLAISKGLGIGIVLASSMVKIPQILLLLRSRSADGLSFTAYLLELTSFVIMSAYSARHGFPFSTYGETVLIAAQDVVVGLLILHFQGQMAAAATFVAGVALAVYLLLFGGGDLVGLKTLQWLQATTGLLAVASKLPQILMVWQQRSTGQLSAFVVSTDPNPPSPFLPPFIPTIFPQFDPSFP